MCVFEHITVCLRVTKSSELRDRTVQVDHPDADVETWSPESARMRLSLKSRRENFKNYQM